MSLEECNKLCSLIIKKINTWPPEPTNSNLISNLSNNISNFGTNLSNKLNQAKEQAANGGRSPQPPTDLAKELPRNDSASSDLKSPVQVGSLELEPLSPTGNNAIKTQNGDAPTLLSPDSNNNSINPKLDADLIVQIERLATQAQFLHDNAVLFDYTGKQVNGYFSMLRILQRFFEYVLYQMEKRKRRFQEYYEIACLLSHVLDSMQQYRSKYLTLRDRFENSAKSVLITEEEDEEPKSVANGSSEISSNDSEDEEDGEEGEFDTISTDMVKLSSDLATSIESLQSHVHFDAYDVQELLKQQQQPEDGPENGLSARLKRLEKISDYYQHNAVNGDAADQEYGKEIKKEEYEKNQPRYYRMFNFNRKETPVSPAGALEESPKKSSQITQKYYKYFANFTKNLEENFSSFTSSSKSNNATNDATQAKQLAIETQIQKARSLQLIKDELEEMEVEETEDEKRVRNAKLDEYTLSKFPDSNDDLHLVTPPMMHFYEGFTLTLNAERELGLLYGRVGAFWYCKSAATVVSLVRNLIVILTSPPSKSIASLCNTDYCGRVFAHRQVNATLDSLVHGLASLEVKAYNKRYFKYLYREHIIYGRTVHMSVNSKFIIPNYGNTLQRVRPSSTSGSPNASDKRDSDMDSGSEEEVNPRTVRCRLLHYVRATGEAELCEDSHNCLVFHVHGGGFVLSSPDSHELYLRDWAVKLKGIPILSVDYVLRKRYPSAPQDVLDVYMTLVDERNQSSITELLGFQPKRIMLVGDSAGANLILSLLCSLNEIRRNNPDYANIRMPIAVLGIYGAFDIRAVMSPSKFISSIDPILHHGNIMAMIGTYAGIAQKIRKTLWSRIKNKRSSAWYRVSERELKSRFKHLSTAMESYFASPLVYPRFDDFCNIPLYLVTTHLCPLVDDSVVLYKAWKGEVVFEIFDGLPHAFLNFCDRSEEAKMATDKCIEKIVQAFQKAANKTETIKYNGRTDKSEV